MQWLEPNGRCCSRRALPGRELLARDRRAAGRGDRASPTRDPQLAVAQLKPRQWYGVDDAGIVIVSRRATCATSSAKRSPSSRACGVGSGQRGSWPRIHRAARQRRGHRGGRALLVGAPAGRPDRDARRRHAFASIARGRALMHQDQLPDAVIVLRAGQVKVSRSTTTGREVVLAIRGPGELLGELAALDGQPRSASVVALEAVEALVLSPQAFRAFLAEPSRRLDGAARDAHAAPARRRRQARRLQLADDAQPGRRAPARAGRPLRHRGGRAARGSSCASPRTSSPAGPARRWSPSAARWRRCARCTGSRRAGGRSASSTSRPCGARPPDHVI